MGLTKLKKLSRDIADAVERGVKKAHRGHYADFGTVVSMGADGTPTQWVDKFAEDIALDIALGKGVSILSEEKGLIDGAGEYTLILDPIDGTRNATHNIPFYAISIAIGKKRLSDVEYGLVRNIPTGDTYTAEKGKGAFLNGKKICVAADVPSNIISPVLGRSGDNKILGSIKNYNIRSLGSAALEMCLVASGSLDAYVMGKELLRSTDIAASTLLVREAGGEVFTAQGEKLDMELSLRDRTSVLAVCSPKILEVLL